MHQQKNLIIFIILAFLIFAGWSLVETWLFPRPPRRPNAGTTGQEVPLHADYALWADLSGTALTATVPGAGGIAPLAAQVGLAEATARERLRVSLARKEQPKPAPKPTPPPAVAQAPVKHEEIDLGGDDYNLKVHLSTRGASIQELVLPHFQAANKMGRPENTQLHLIPAAASRKEASNVLYHYAAVDDDRPVDTLGQMEWAVEERPKGPEEGTQSVTFVADVPGTDVRVFKTFTLARADYHLGLTVRLQRREGTGTDPVRFRYQLTSGHGLPIEGEWYTSIFRNGLTGRVDAKGSLWRDLQDSRSVGVQAGGNEVRKGDMFIQYAGVAIQYFASVLVVDDQQAPGQKKDFLAWARPTLPVGAERDIQRPELDDVVTRAVSEPVDLKPGEAVTHKYLLYNGPVKVRLLSELGGEGPAVPPELVHRYADTLHLRTLQEFGSFSFWSDLLIWFTNLMHGIMRLIHLAIPNYGLCIILLTLLVRGMMFPISRKQAQASARMQSLAPELKKLQEKYKNDKQAMGMAQMELYRKHGVNPLGSCWVLLLQMPIFLGLYYSLQESIHFRLAPFLWIKNLAAPDMLIYWGQSIPILTRPEDAGSFLYLGPYFNLLPVIAVVLMIVQQKLMTPPAMDEQQEMQQKMMKYMMIVFGLMFYKIAAGLCLYFTVSSLWGLAERKLLPKAKPGGIGGMPSGPPKGSGARSRPRAPKDDGDGMLAKMKDKLAEILKEAKKK